MAVSRCRGYGMILAPLITGRKSMPLVFEN
jgi:hypothetical protein